MIQFLQQVPVDRLLLVLFLAGQLLERFRAGERSRRDQGKRLGALADRVTALEASRGHG